MTYITRQLKTGRTEQLDDMAREAGITYSQTVVTFWRVVRHNRHWLSKYAMMKLIRNSKLHSQTVQGIVDTFFESLLSWRARRNSNQAAHPPRRLRRYHAIPFKESAISLKDGVLRLSAGKGNDPVVIPWKWSRPKTAGISWNGEEYVINAVYAGQSHAQAIGDGHACRQAGCAGIDLGEIHIAVAATGKRVIIANGRELRSKRRYQNKVKASFQRGMDKCKKHSRGWERLNKARKRTLRGLNNQIKDVLHKQTTKIVRAVISDGVRTVGIGDLRDLRASVDYGHNANQRIHQMSCGRAREMLTYKALRAGLTVKLINEAYTSQTCPVCGKRHKPGDRNYKCPSCGFKYHRDGVGAINIRQKTMYRELVPVVGDMTPPAGLRYTARTVKLVSSQPGIPRL